MGLVGGVVVGDQAVGEQQHRVGVGGAVHERAAALGLQLVAEVADEAAGEVERELSIGERDLGEGAIEPVEQAAAVDLAPPAPVQRQLTRGHVVADERRERTAARAHVGEPREPRAVARAVEPEGVGRRAEQTHERALRIRRPAYRPHHELEPAPRLAPVHRLQRPRSGCFAGRPAASAGSPRALRQPAEVLEQPLAPLGLHRLRVKLHTPVRPLAVAHGHHGAGGRARGHLERRRERLVHRQRVVAHGEEPLRDPPEQLGVLVVDAAAAAVHRPRRGADLATVREHQALVPEAHPEHRQLGRRQRAARKAEVARAVGPPGPAEITHREKRSARSAAQSASSLRTTTGSRPSTTASSWKRLNVFESWLSIRSVLIALSASQTCTLGLPALA